MEEFGLSHEAVAKRVGKSRVAVTNTLRLLGLPDVVKQALVDGKITEGHARALLALSTQKAQASALQTVINLSLNVRQTEELMQKTCGAETDQGEKTNPKRGCERCGKTPTAQPRYQSLIEAWQKRRHGHHLLLFW